MKNNKKYKYIMQYEFINNFLEEKIDVNLQTDSNEFYLSFFDVIEDNLDTKKI